MSTYTKTMTQAQSKVLSGLKELTSAQEQVIAAARQAGGTTTEELPSLSQVIENAYGFAGQLLEVQRAAVLSWIELIAPGAPTGARTATAAKTGSN